MARSARAGLFIGLRAMDDLASALAAIAFIAVLLVTMLFNVDRLQGLSSMDGPTAVQMAQSQLIPCSCPCTGPSKHSIKVKTRTHPPT